MNGIARLALFFALGYGGTCATRQLLLGDAGRGRNVFHSQKCILCHSVNSEGGRVGPDLAQMVDQGFTPYRMAALLWNHAPTMWRNLEQNGIARPNLTRQQAADLFAYFYAIRCFERPGDEGRGKRVFESNGCARCHGIDAPVSSGVAPARSWQSLDHPILLAQQMWSHPRAGMVTAFDQSGTPFPQLSAQDLTDMLAYLRSVLNRGENGYFVPGSPEEGGELFVTKGCAACHQGSHAMEGRPTRYTLNDFAAAMWNHPQRTAPDSVPISVEEMRRLVGYLLSIQFFEERGDAERGKLLFRKKRCVACHEVPSSGAPGRQTMAGQMTSYDMMAALWKHGPKMNAAMRRKKIRWPRFDAAEMADVTAYLHGYEFKRRQPANLR